MRLTYKEFKEKVENEILDYMPEEYEAWKVWIRPTAKVNDIKDGMSILSLKRGVAPIMYIDEMYLFYCKDGDFEQTMREAVKAYISMDTRYFATPEGVLGKINADNLYIELVNTKENTEMISNIPNRAWNDLSIVYKIKYSSADGTCKILVTNEVQKLLRMSEEELYQAAYKNIIKDIMIENLAEVLIRAIGYQVANMEIDEIEAKETIKLINTVSNKAWVITNHKCVCGAAAVLDTDTLESIAADIDADLVLLPSSAHEMMIIPKVVDIEMAKSWVRTVNRESLPREDFLSDNVYVYDRATKKVSIG